jgi:superfamily I DNA/RNA helicase
MNPFEANAFPLDPGIRLLEASAGTGKTFALAHLVLRLVAERGWALRELLVVTFTEAAVTGSPAGSSRPSPCWRPAPWIPAPASIPP